MALDPRISLAVQPSGILEAAQQGLQFGQQYKQQKAMGPLQQEALKAQTAQSQAETGKLDMSKQIAGAGYMANSIKQLQAIPLEQRWPMAQMQMAQMQRFGMSSEGITEADMSDEALQRYYDVVAPVAQMGMQGSRAGFQAVGTPVLGYDSSGKLVSSVNVFNPSTGETESKIVPTNVAQLANRNTGLTAAEADQARFAQAGNLLGLRNEYDEAAIREQADAKARSDALAVTQKVEAEAVETKKATLLNNGEVAAVQLPRLNTVLSLLKSDRVATGGVNALYKDIANALNLDTADAETVERAFKKDLLDASADMKGVLVKSDFDLLRGTGADYSIGTKANIQILEGMQKRLNNAVVQGKKVVEKSPNYSVAYPYLSEFNSTPQKNADREPPKAPPTQKTTPPPTAPQGTTGQKPAQPVMTKALWDKLKPEQRQSYKDNYAAPGFDESLLK
jgi:hypothetical protein